MSTARARWSRTSGTTWQAHFGGALLGTITYDGTAYQLASQDGLHSSTNTTLKNAKQDLRKYLLSLQ